MVGILTILIVGLGLIFIIRYNAKKRADHARADKAAGSFSREELLEGIEKSFPSKSEKERLETLFAFQTNPFSNIPYSLLWLGAKDPSPEVRLSTMRLCLTRSVPPDLLEHGARDEDKRVRLAAISAAALTLADSVIEIGLNDPDVEVREKAAQIKKARPFSDEAKANREAARKKQADNQTEARAELESELERLCSEEAKQKTLDCYERLLNPSEDAEKAARELDQLELPPEIVELLARNPNSSVQAAAMQYCRRETMPLSLFEIVLSDEVFSSATKAAMEACEKRQIPTETIERWLDSPSRWLRIAALKACRGRDVPLRYIEKGMQDKVAGVRTWAMSLCCGRAVPLELLEKGLADANPNVRRKALAACEGRPDAQALAARAAKPGAGA